MDPKKLEIVEMVGLFLVGCFFITTLPNFFNPYSNFFASIA